MQAQQLVGLNLMMAKAGLTGLSGAATTFTTANAVTFLINSIWKSKAAVSGGTTPVVDAVTGLPITLTATTAQGKGMAVAWCMDASGNIATVRGTTENIDAAGNFLFGAPQLPGLPDTLVIFAYSISKSVAGSAVFTMGVSNWNLTGVTHTFADVAGIPNRPQIV